MCSSLACLSFTMVRRPSSLNIVLLWTKSAWWHFALLYMQMLKLKNTKVRRAGLFAIATSHSCQFLDASSIIKCSLQCLQLTIITINSHLVGRQPQTCRDGMWWSGVGWHKQCWGQTLLVITLYCSARITNVRICYHCMTAWGSIAGHKQQYCVCWSYICYLA